MPLLSGFQVTVDGQPLDDVLNINISQDIYNVGEIALYCRFESMEDADSFLIEQSKKLLGTEVLIQTELIEPNSSSGKPGFQFLGIITEIQGVKTDMSDNNGILLFGKSPEILMQNRPKTRAFLDSTLKDIVNEVLKDYDQGLLKPKVKPRNKQKFSYLVQYNENDLEFLRRLSVTYGEWFYFNGSELIFGENNPKDLDLTVGVDLEKFVFNLRTKANGFELKTYDTLNDKVHSYSSSRINPDGDLSTYGKFAHGVTKKIYPGSSVSEHSHWNVSDSDIPDAIKTATDLEVRSSAINHASIRGEGSHAGMSVGIVGAIKAQKQNSRGTIDYGKYLFTRINHFIDHLNNYHNNFTGTSKESTLPENTNSRLFRESGPHVAEVTDNTDPEKLGRIRVKFSWVTGDKITQWIPVLSPYVTASAGFYFVPAVGSLVLIDFEGGNIDKPFCAGSLYHKKSTPEGDWAGNKNSENAKIHAIRTEGGNTIEFHDEDGDKLIRIYDTDNKNEIILNSTKGEISIRAKDKLSLDAKEIEIKASDGIKIEAGKGMKLKAQEISSEAQTKMESKAANVEISANASLKMEGSASVKLASSGVMTIQGSLVKIN